ncbi:hypothetical protein FGU65_03530 [Methanoculleus sp. FWC-SCC1]|uniref:Uncharacterized protein n=1 Tax=Methanoculleus frigidifontis TaxID=2584085 RepID=A0ABT8M7R7_9EURY|nr:hypothetical protein [Methanoculleus sp. FWC-SCC1]MDN7023973.1 hypothetical protein [Methanoculleus sp. FWC-SCC1]
MANNPYDEMFRNIARLMEKLLNDMPAEDARVIGFTIVAGPGGAAPPFDLDDVDTEEPEVEVIEDDTCIFITAQVDARAAATGAPYVTFDSDSVTLCTGGGEETVIELECEIDTIHSFYNVQHGVIDATCRKKHASGART